MPDELIKKANLQEIVDSALELKQSPFSYQYLGTNKTIGLIFLNPSLRTRLSTQKAALNLGMTPIVMNMDKEGWGLEIKDIAMNGTTARVELSDASAGVFGAVTIIGGVVASGTDFVAAPVDITAPVVVGAVPFISTY